MKLVTLENDPDNSWSLNNTLRQGGYHCRGYQSIDVLIESPWVEEADLAIIDGDGMKLDKRLIERLGQTFWPERPMLFVGNDERQLSRLAREADVTLLKPVSARGLIASVKSTLSKTWDQYATSDATQFGRYQFEPRGHAVLVDGTRVTLTQKEFQLALLLFRNLARPVSRVYIAGAVWRHDERINARTMTAHVSTIRSKLQLRADADYDLTPIYNYGYRLDPVRRQRALNAVQQPSPHLPAAVPG
ncbi:response regulator transcription factor [Paraburkholderia sp.]|jgi:DNA-binding response OmpR family regulator|uniref:response regulator transcription factor n=1 Tax=Paraburkholderia sp. TaxID=1926495 RepID=UPI002F4001F5